MRLMMAGMTKSNQREARLDDETDKMKDNVRLSATRSRRYMRCSVCGVEKLNF
jgi:hypothetical protein